MAPRELYNCSILLSKIAFTSEWNLHPWDSQTISDTLLQSFHRTGIIHPPILLAKDDGFFDILCGRKRLQFALENSQVDSVVCLVFANNTEVAVLLDTLLTDQSFYHPLSLAEKAKFIEICTRFLKPQDIVSLYLERLQLRKKTSTINELINILQQHPTIIAEIHAGRLQEKMVMELLRLPESSDRIALVQLFRDLVMGDGKQKRFFSLIRDLAFRQNISISQYLKLEEISGILEHPVLNGTQKVHHLSNYLQHQLSPVSREAEEGFTRQVRALHLSPQCTISHSPSFEKDDIIFSITFGNFADCALIAPKINKLLESNSYLK
jgi:hypothetical protein